MEKMNDFNIENFDVNSDFKYQSCITKAAALSSETLTRLYQNGWKVISFNVYSKPDMAVKEFYYDHFAYMFENMNYEKF